MTNYHPLSSGAPDSTKWLSNTTTERWSVDLGRLRMINNVNQLRLATEKSLKSSQLPGIWTPRTVNWPNSYVLTIFISNRPKSTWRPRSHLLWEPLGVPHLFTA